MSKNNETKISVGGQALIEGIMMMGEGWRMALTAVIPR